MAEPSRAPPDHVLARDPFLLVPSRHSSLVGHAQRPAAGRRRRISVPVGALAAPQEPQPGPLERVVDASRRALFVLFVRLALTALFYGPPAALPLRQVPRGYLAHRRPRRLRRAELQRRLPLPAPRQVRVQLRRAVPRGLRQDVRDMGRLQGVQGQRREDAQGPAGQDREAPRQGGGRRGQGRHHRKDGLVLVLAKKRWAKRRRTLSGASWRSCRRGPRESRGRSCAAPRSRPGRP
mmetsp:Transcript_11416/g.39285  ORF Transcript_11416/g.39285 Transcript_11416/m.39285 type:complete len:236 (+) Transcript_11416:417-1124(+)